MLQLFALTTVTRKKMILQHWQQEFIGYMGWIKVAETLLNPWGDDEEDFQINYLIDRNFQVSVSISSQG
jgi:Bestrophin, RFP-TM, chloride channel